VDGEAQRLEILAGEGDLHRALETARQAEALAQTPEERYRSAELLVLIEHESGHHTAELQHARLLVMLRPNSDRALRILRRAVRCAGTDPPP